MNHPAHVGPLELLSDELSAMEADIYGIAALGHEISMLFDAERRAARQRLLTTIAAATLFSTLLATSAALGFGHTGVGALAIGVFAGFAAASSVLLTCPAPLCVSRACTRLQAWWHR